MILFEMFQERRQFLKLQALTSIHQQSCAGKVAFARRMEFGKDGNEVYGQVIHAVEAHVLKGAQDSAFPGTGESGEDNELARVSSLSGGRLHRKRLSFLHGVGACWECACLLDISRPCGA